MEGVWAHTAALLERCESPAERAIIEAMTDPAPESLEGQFRVWALIFFKDRVAVVCFWLNVATK